MKPISHILIPAAVGAVLAASCTTGTAGSGAALGNLLTTIAANAQTAHAAKAQAPHAPVAVNKVPSYAPAVAPVAAPPSGMSPHMLLERIFVTHVRAMNQHVTGQAAVAELNRYMDKIIADTKTLNVQVERMSPGEKASFAVLMKSYLQRHLRDGATYQDVHMACMLANPPKYGIFRGYFNKVLSMLPKPQ